MKPCTKCAHQNGDAVAFCVQCGTPMNPAQRVCPRGHILEPDASTCPYCSELAPAPPVAGRPETPRRRTEVVDVRTNSAAASAPPVAGRPPARAPAAVRPARKTEFYSPEQESAAPARPPDRGAKPSGRKIVGVLLTYSWRREGQLFPVREGRNFVGRGDGCDIHLSDDASLSERHCHISFQGRFVIGDLISMTGTFVNGEAVLSQFEPLPNQARLRTGSTDWVFVSLLERDTTPGNRSAPHSETEGQKKPQ